MSNGDRERIEELIAGRMSGPEPDLGRIGEGLADRAEREGLLGWTYATADSPVGELLLAGTDEGLVALGFPTVPAERRIEELARALGARALERRRRFDRALRQLDEYFEGERREFDLELDWRLSRGFTREVLATTAAIPYGSTLSYAELAARAGRPRAHRAAGSALGANPIPIVVPCHRVLRTGGALGGYTGGLEIKRRLLRLEGVEPGA